MTRLNGFQQDDHTHHKMKSDLSLGRTYFCTGVFSFELGSYF